MQAFAHDDLVPLPGVVMLSTTATTSTASERLKAYQIRVPVSCKEAMASPESNQWWDAMNDQIDKLEAANTYDIKPMPSDPSIKILPGKWVYALKIDKEGYVTAFKARWVV